MRRRKNTPEQVQFRQEILQKIATQPPLSEELRDLQTTEGFYHLYTQIRLSYPNNIEAYEAIEEEYIRIFGHRKYSEYDSFRSSMTQKMSRK